jgi:uncharacterized membrane protein
MAVAASIAAAAIFAMAAHAADGEVGDAEALAIVQAHCAFCHAARPAHPAFAQPPKNVKLETPAELKQRAATVLQSLLNRTMPLGNLTGMTEAERAKLLAWAQAQN